MEMFFLARRKKGLHFFFDFCLTGLLIPANCVSPLINKLSTSDQSQQLAVQEQQKRQQLHPQSLSHAPSTGPLGIMGASIPSPSF